MKIHLWSPYEKISDLCGEYEAQLMKDWDYRLLESLGNKEEYLEWSRLPYNHSPADFIAN